MSAGIPAAFLESGSYLRFDNATWGYSFPTGMKNVKKIRLYLNAQNIFIITDYRGAASILKWKSAG
jgi:hypothetical protein